MKRRKPIPFRAPAIVYQDGTHIPRARETIKQFFLFSSQRIRAIFVASLLILISSSLGIFVYRILGLPNINVVNILNAIFKRPLPSLPIIIGALVSSILYGIFFFRAKRQGIAIENNTPPLTRFLTIISILVGFDLYYLRINSISLTRGNIDFRNIEEYLCAQLATLVFMMFLGILFHRLATVTTSAPFSVKLPTHLLNTYGWIRLLAVALVIIVGVLIITTTGLPSIYNHSLFTYPKWPTYTRLGALLMSIVVAAIAYWPPKFRQTKGSFGIIRLIVITIGIVCIGLLYREVNNSEGFIAAIISAFLLTLISTPLQRSLS
jgi:hypothetical protein